MNNPGHMSLSGKILSKVVTLPYGSAARRNIRCRSATNGRAQNGSAIATKDMYIADLDMSRDDPYAPHSEPVTVPDNSSSPPGLRLAAAPSNAGLVPAADMEHLKLQLHRAKEDLANSEMEVDQLRSTLAERDRSLHRSKSELIEARVALSEKEELLDEAYDRLRRSTHERSEYRRYLLEAEQELQTTRANLMEWSQGLMELKSVMEGLDNDLSDLVGPAAYRAALSEIEDSLDGMSSDGEPAISFKFDADELDAITEALKDLQQLSAEVLHEARQDGEYFIRDDGYSSQ